MSREITNYEDVIDSRDVINRIDELEEQLSEGLVTVAAGDLDKDEYDELSDELVSLRKLADQCEGCGDWQWGEGLIRDSHFEDYARELAEDTGEVDRNAHWPHNCIDWQQAAEELQQDFTSVDFDGVTYWIRS